MQPETRFYSRTLLVDEHGQALQATNLAAGRNYIFHYPFEATPRFLLNLGKPTVQNVALKTEDGGSYEWPGGVGPNRAIVGYSAICAHRMIYPTRQISFISYRDQPDQASGCQPERGGRAGTLLQTTDQVLTPRVI